MLDKDLATAGELGTLRGMRGTLTLLATLAALTALPASAGTLYKCTGADGVPNYVSKRVSGASWREAICGLKPFNWITRSARKR